MAADNPDAAATSANESHAQPATDSGYSKPSQHNGTSEREHTSTTSLPGDLKNDKHNESADHGSEPKSAQETEQKAVNANEQDSKKQGDKASHDSSSVAESEPAGGYDATPIPDAPPGYTLQITIHRAKNLPMADISTLSSDPYVLSQMYTDNRTRHKEDPALQMRTFTIRKQVDPEWNARWTVANVPASGFRLKCRIYDEDPANHDDRLGNAHISVPSLSDSWKGFQEKSFKIKKRMGSKRAYAAQGIATAVGKRKGMDGFLIVSIENMGRTESQHGGRLYTVGPAFWIKHYSPLLGRVMGQKTPGQDEANAQKENKEEELEEKPKKGKSERYNFQANQLQLNGPIPAELYHRYVEFRPFVKRMFTGKGLRGYFMNKVLMHQHDQIYHWDRTTECGYLADEPNKETTLKFLDLVHYDEGGRIFTYVLTLDALMRFTETGKEFGIQMLSKHTLHSCAETYIAFSGEFLIRRLKNKDEPGPEAGGNNESHPSSNFSGGQPNEDSPKNPRQYELIIDNDSGTYRPNAKLLPKLKEFLEHALPGLHIVVLDCQADADEQQRIKKEQLQKKKEEGDNIIYKPMSRGSSISSSDESDLDSLMGEGNSNHFYSTIKKDLTRRSKMRGAHYRNVATGKRDHKNEVEHVKGKEKAEETTNGNGAANN